MTIIPAWIRRFRMIRRWTRPMRSWIDSAGRTSSAPPRRPSLIFERSSRRELFEEAGLQVARPDGARTRLQQASDLCPTDVDAAPGADALELARSRPSRERAPAARNLRGGGDAARFGRRDQVRWDARHAQVPEDGVELEPLE